MKSDITNNVLPLKQFTLRAYDAVLRIRPSSKDLKGTGFSRPSVQVLFEVISV